MPSASAHLMASRTCARASSKRNAVCCSLKSSGSESVASVCAEGFMEPSFMQCYNITLPLTTETRSHFSRGPLRAFEIHDRCETSMVGYVSDLNRSVGTQLSIDESLHHRDG